MEKENIDFSFSKIKHKKLANPITIGLWNTKINSYNQNVFKNLLNLTGILDM